MFLITLQRELNSYIKSGSDIIYAAGFYALIVLATPLLGQSAKSAEALDISTLWLALLFAAMLTLPHMYQRDYADGTLQQYKLLSMPLELTVMIKCISHWLASGVLIALLLSGLSYIVAIEHAGVELLCASILLGSWCITCVGSIGASIMTAARSGALLVALLLLPLFIPVLIFGSSVAQPELAATGQGEQALLILIALALALTPVSVVATSYIIRNTE